MAQGSSRITVRAARCTIERISAAALRALQALYAAYDRRDLLDAGEDSRGRRLRWASQQIGHDVRSFKDLTGNEAHVLIRTLKGALGQPLDRLDSEGGRAAGTEGRRWRGRELSTLASQQDLDLVRMGIARLGWDQARFEAWLRSPSGPLPNKSAPQVPQIRTVGDANRVWWALKRMLVRSGRWRTQKTEAA